MELYVRTGSGSRCPEVHGNFRRDLLLQRETRIPKLVALEDGRENPSSFEPGDSTTQPLMVLEAASQVTGLRRKNDSLAMWQASAAWWPKIASSTTGCRDRTAWKNVQR
jgi:hypothetical protein